LSSPNRATKPFGLVGSTFGMIHVPLAMHRRLMKGEVPISYILIETHMGYRVYAEKEGSGVFDPLGNLLDGSWTLGGTEYLGSESAGVLSKDGRVLSFGTFERSIQSIKSDVLGSYQSKTLQHMSVDLDDGDGALSALIAMEPFISRSLQYYVGFEDDPQSDHLKMFSGIINEVSIRNSIMTIEADEGETALDDTFYLDRASRYSSPLNSNDRLPIPYGDLTDGSTGVWTLPCIDTANFVYCFGDCEVLTVAGGNSISIYADGVLVNPADYTFDESNNYEAKGLISTITFTSDQANKVISARGKGKVLTEVR